MLSVGSGLFLWASFSRSRDVFALDFRFRLGVLGRLDVMELLVADMKLEFAAFRIGVGRARRMRCEVGIAFVGGRGVWADAPKTDI